MIVVSLTVCNNAIVINGWKMKCISKMRLNITKLDWFVNHDNSLNGLINNVHA